MEERLLLVDVAIILGAAFPLLFIGRKWRVPEVISYLLTGIVIGPHALGWIKDAHRVEAIAEIGVALILFFIGLHVPIAKLRTLGRTTFVAGGLQMGLTVAVVVAMAVAIGLDPVRATFYGLMVALGSTAVVLPILTSRDEMGAPFAQRFLGVSLFQDFAVIPLMLLVPAFATGEGAPEMGTIFRRVIIAIAGVVLLVIIARVVVPKLFTRIAALGSREIFTAAAIVLILATIAITERLGVSAALGAFAAGVVIGDTEFIHDISGILRPFRDFLSALFFASIGMLLQPRYVLAHLNLVLMIVAVVVLTKIVAAYPAFRAAGALPRTSLRAAFAVAPIGEFSFLLAQEGKRRGVLAPSDEQMLIAVAVLTLASTPVLVSTGMALATRLRGKGEQTEDEKIRRKGHILIVGYGLNGQNVARVLGATGVGHVILEEDPTRAEVARAAGSDVIVTDAADPEALHSAGIDQAIAVVIAISDPDGTRRIVHSCRSVNASIHILVRTRYVSEVERLRSLGANEVIPEEFETSIEIVTRLMRLLAVPGNLVAAQLRLLRDEGYKMLRDPALRAAEGRRLSAVLSAGTAQTFLVMPDTFAEGKTLEELGIAEDHIAVPAILRDGVPITSPSHDERIRTGDTLFLVGAHEDLVRVTDRLEEASPATSQTPSPG
jgi:monovalent cation:H+ antiporter-2, CPA2 family